MILINNRVQPW